MFGTPNATESGVLSRSVAYMLSTNRQVYATVIEMIDSDLYDLSNTTKLLLKSNEKPRRCLVESNEKFNHLLSRVLKLRVQKPTNENKTSSRSHLFFEFWLRDTESASMAFIDLAGWENPNHKENSKETQFINSSLTSLNSVLTSISQENIPSYSSKLSKMFKPYLKANSKTCMLYHVSNAGLKKGLENIKDAVPSNKANQYIRKALSDVTNKLG